MLGYPISKGDNMYFRGYENVKLDGKNRIIIPASFREKLSSERLILTRATVLELPVIAVFPTEEIFQSNIANYLSLNHDEFYNRNLSLMTSEVCMDSAKK